MSLRVNNLGEKAKCPIDKNLGKQAKCPFDKKSKGCVPFAVFRLHFGFSLWLLCCVVSGCLSDSDESLPYRCDHGLCPAGQSCVDGWCVREAAEGPCPSGFVEVPAGTFTMGSPNTELGRGSDETEHQVTLTRSFCLQETEVTQAQFQATLGYNPSHFPSCGGNCPVESVNWHEAAAYCNKLSDALGASHCYNCKGSGSSVSCSPVSGSPYSCAGYRLPTEAEWEYAARAGTSTPFYNGGISQTDCSMDSNLNAIGWYCGNSSDRTHAVKGKQANAWGLYDMSGNVWEWCHDWYGHYRGAETDPYGPSAGALHSPRGGGCFDRVECCRSASRYNGGSGRDHGFRPAKSL